MGCPYNADVMAIGRPASKDAPIFGQRLAALRRGKGLSQRELAEKLNTTREAIDYYERRAQNPTLDLIQRLAEALDVTVAELLGSEPQPVRARPGPVPQLQLRFEQIKQLPRQQQEFVLHFLDTVLGTAEKRQAARRSANTSPTKRMKLTRQEATAKKK